MKLTKSQKAIIRRHHWADRRLKFLKDGTVLARKGTSEPWGVLYHPADTQAHLDAVKM